MRQVKYLSSMQRVVLTHQYMDRPFNASWNLPASYANLSTCQRGTSSISNTHCIEGVSAGCVCVCEQSLVEEDFDKLKADQQTWKITGNSKRPKCSINSLTDCTTISWYGKSTWFNWYPLMLTKENINFTYKKVSYTQKKERKEIPHYGCIPMLLILETG